MDTSLQRSKQRLPVSGIIGNYFHFITALAAIGAWLLAFVSQIVVTILVGRSAVGVMWFGIFLQLFVIIEVLGVLAYGNIASFRLQVSLFGTMSTVFAVKGVDLSIFSGEPSRDAMAAGWLTLAMADILWVLYFSSEPGTPFFRLVDSMQIKDRPKTVTDSEHPHYGPATNKSNPNDADMRSDGSPDETKVGHEKGFEDAEETAHYRNQLERRIVDEPRQVLEERADEVSDRRHHHTSPPSSFNNRRAVYVQEHRQLSTIYDTKTEIGSSTSSSDPDSFFNLYPFKVRAKSDWIPKSPSEISFRKGDVLHSSEREGKKWWQVRKADGTTGSAPSNYFHVVA